MGYFGGGGGSGSAGANTALSNLVAPTAVNATLLPGALGIDIGSSAAPFDEIFVGVAAARLRLGTTVVGGFGTIAGISSNFSRVFIDPGWVVGNGAACILTNDAGLYFADSAGEHLISYNASQVPLTLTCAMGTTSRSVLFIERGDETFNFAVPQQTNPTIVICSAAQSTQQRIGIRHNQTQGQIVDLATTAASGRPIGFHGGSAVASAATITPTGNVFHVTGTTNIDNITIMAAGTSITVVFDGILTVGDAGNLKLTAALVTTADDTLTLMSDGTNWYEVARAVN